MRRELAQVNPERIGQPLRMRMALNSGRALTGDIGSPKRREFTVLGDVVNIASRMESSVAQPDQIVISQHTRDMDGRHVCGCGRSVSCHSAAGSRTWRHSK